LLKSFLLTPIIFALAVAPALAKPTVVAELGTAPLLGASNSTADMRSRVAANAGFVKEAAHKLGLSSSEYTQFASAVANSRVVWVTVPRHLDAMTWRSGNKVYLLRDVVIPANSRGWKVELHTTGQRVSLYMPAACGNLSIVRTPIPAIAYKPAVIVPPVPVAAVVPVEEPQAAVAVIPDDTPAVPVRVAKADFPPVIAPRGNALFFAPLLFGLAALVGGGGGGASFVPVPNGCP